MMTLGKELKLQRGVSSPLYRIRKAAGKSLFQGFIMICYFARLWHDLSRRVLRTSLALSSPPPSLSLRPSRTACLLKIMSQT